MNKTFFFGKIPFTYHWIVRRAVGDNIDNVLDLGCGDGGFMKDISRSSSWKRVGIDLHEDSTEKARELGIYKKVITGNVLKLPKGITNKKYDVVFSSQVIEHLDKRKANSAIKHWETLARKRIVISTTVGFIDYEPIEEKPGENNPYQKHRSSWLPKEFRRKGYVIRGQGLKYIYGKKGLARKTSPKLLSLWGLFSYLASPLVYFFPNYGLIMVCKKEIYDN